MECILNLVQQQIWVASLTKNEEMEANYTLDRSVVRRNGKWDMKGKAKLSVVEGKKEVSMVLYYPCPLCPSHA